MVCTRKKDYGEPPLKQRQVVRTRKDAILKPDAAAVAGDDNQDESKEPHTENKEPCSEFTLFSKLPCELRLEVWKHSMAPRLVVVAPKTLGKRRLQHSRKMLPAQFSVNSESRECAIRRYNLRFTIKISVTIDRLPRHCLDLSRGARHHAHVVMSPDDTLGFLGWDDACSAPEHCWNFRVEHSYANSPWYSRKKPITSGAQPEVKKVVWLGKALVYKPRIVHDLDSTASWDLDSISQQKSATARKFGGPCHSLCQWKGSYAKDHLLISYFRSVANFQEWGRFILPNLCYCRDIWRFELGCNPPTTSKSEPFSRVI